MKYMENKICSQCGETKLIGDFYKKKGYKTPQSKCKTCFNKYCTDRWVNKKIFFIEYLGSKCFDCGISYPKEPYAIFDFHHRDPNKKEFDWSKLRLKSDIKIKEEVDKCDLLCSNCHRKRHFYL
jgi:hypothetical protein